MSRKPWPILSSLVSTEGMTLAMGYGSEYGAENRSTKGSTKVLFHI